MDKFQEELIKSIATDSRAWAEDTAYDMRERGIICMKESLEGMCAIASGHLHDRLKDAGIDSEIYVYGTGELGYHVYVVVDDHVLDITATQFNEFKNTPVVLMHCREATVYTFYNGEQQFRDVSSLRKYQKKTGWVFAQIALPS